MSLEKAKKLIDEIAQMETVPTIQPHIVTEPFANEDLKEIIPYCRSKNIPLSIITNGILLNKGWMDFLIQCLDRSSTISFSLDATTQATYEKVRGTYSLIELEKKIVYFMNCRSTKGPRIGVNFVCEEDNYAEKDILGEKWKDKVDVVHIGIVLDSQRRIPETFRKSGIIKSGDVCPFLQEVMAIDSGGEVRICSVDAFGEIYLGNVFEEGILSVWNGKRKKCFCKNMNRISYRRMIFAMDVSGDIVFISLIK